MTCSSSFVIENDCCTKMIKGRKDEGCSTVVAVLVLQMSNDNRNSLLPLCIFFFFDILHFVFAWRHEIYVPFSLINHIKNRSFLLYTEYKRNIWAWKKRPEALWLLQFIIHRPKSESVTKKGLTTFLPREKYKKNFPKTFSALQ